MSQLRPAPRTLAALLAATLAAGLLPVPAAVAAPPAAPVPDASAADRAAIRETVLATPTGMYLDAMAHAHDRIAFTPGGRVTVPFTPRADDRWPVGGRAPVALPAGRATGAEIARQATGSVWADAAAGPPPAGAVRPGAPVDAPANVLALPATGTAAVAPASDAPSADALAGMRRQFLGFLPYWELSGAATSLNYDLISTIAYFSIGADGAGNLIRSGSGWTGWTSSNLTSVIDAAHSRGTRVVLTITCFAWTSGQVTTQKSLLGSAAARQNLARQVAAAVRDRGVDGVNLDFEPLVSGYETQFVDLLRLVRAELDALAPGYQLTYDTLGQIGNYPIEASVAPGAADAIFVMGYDYRTASTGYVGSIDPLTGPAYDLTDTVRAYVARVPASKVILGVPWYGRAWSTETDLVNARNISGEQYGYSATVNYDTAAGLAAQYGRRWDSRELSPWFVYRRQNCTTTYGCVTPWRQVYYDDAQSTKLRYDMVNAYGLRGAGVWALGYDGGRPELYGAVRDAFVAPPSGPAVGVPVLAPVQRDAGFRVGWTSSAAAPAVRWDVEVSADGGPWTRWLTGTTATADTWLGEHGRGYAFRVRGTDALGKVSAWNVTAVWQAAPALAVGGFARTRIADLNYRSGPGTSAVRLGSLPADTLLALTGGPVAADGYTWWQATGPVAEWAPTSFAEAGIWVAGGTTADPTQFLRPVLAPHATTVDAGLRDLGFGTGETAGGASARQLSPNGDGRADTLTMTWTNAVALDSLDLVLRRADGTTAGTIDLRGSRGAGPQAWTWDGVLDRAPVPDGTYLATLEGTAGTTTFRAPAAGPVTDGQLAAYGITVDTVAPAIDAATVAAPLFSPNGDGVRDTVAVTLAAPAAVRWELRAGPAGGPVLRTLAASGGSGSLAWDGRADDGTAAPDGAYRLEATAYDLAGNAASRTLDVAIDRVAPVLGAAATPVTFSPNGDGAAETTVLAWTADEPASGTARIYRGTTLVRTWTVAAGTAGRIAWDGRTAAGTLQPDGAYRWRLELADAAGTRSVREVTVVKDGTLSTLRWSRNFFPQDADSLVPTGTVSFRLARTATTTVRILDAAGTIVRTAWASRSLAAGTWSWTWNGRKADGTWAPQGRYTAYVTARTSLGTVVLTRAVVVAAFSTSVSAPRVRAGETLTLSFRTIETLGTRPVVTFGQPGLAGVARTAEKLADGSYRVSFVVAPGAAGVASLRIVAKDAYGRTNAQTVTVEIVP